MEFIKGLFGKWRIQIDPEQEQAIQRHIQKYSREDDFSVLSSPAPPSLPGPWDRGGIPAWSSAQPPSVSKEYRFPSEYPPISSVVNDNKDDTTTEHPKRQTGSHEDSLLLSRSSSRSESSPVSRVKPAPETIPLLSHADPPHKPEEQLVVTMTTLAQIKKTRMSFIAVVCLTVLVFVLAVVCIILVMYSLYGKSSNSRTVSIELFLDDARTGDVVLFSYSKFRKWGTRFIQWIHKGWVRSEWTHAGVVFRDPLTRKLYILEMVAGCHNLRNYLYDEAPFTSDGVRLTDFKELATARFHDRARGYLGWRRFRAPDLPVFHIRGKELSQLTREDLKQLIGSPFGGLSHLQDTMRVPALLGVHTFIKSISDQAASPSLPLASDSREEAKRKSCPSSDLDRLWHPFLRDDPTLRPDHTSAHIDLSPGHWCVPPSMSCVDFALFVLFRMGMFRPDCAAVRQDGKRDLSLLFGHNNSVFHPINRREDPLRGVLMKGILPSHATIDRVYPSDVNTYIRFI